MSALKLLKKRELNMSRIYKNGKLYTYYIYSAIFLLFIFIINIHTTNGNKNSGKWIIVLDPGHGGKDPGALGSFSQEKNINLAIALKTGEYLTKNVQNVEVVYTRNDDSTVDLLDRPGIANRNKADLFISIHSNWARNKNVSGAETYIMGLAKDEDNLAVAMKENEVILLEDDYTTKYQGFDPKSPESYIIFTLTQNVYQKQSADLAMRIQTQFKERANRNDRGVRQAGFWVLFNTTMPSVLIETGFITNQTEEKYLNTEKGQDFLASAIFRACRDYINDLDNRSVISVMEKEKAVNTRPEKAEPIHRDNGIVFMVQVASASSRTEIRPENFRGLNDIIEINVQDRYKYATGKFHEYPEAVRYRRKVEEIYPDAFVIAVKDNKVLPLQEALDMKKKE